MTSDELEQIQRHLTQRTSHILSLKQRTSQGITDVLIETQTHTATISHIETRINQLLSERKP